MGQNKKIKVLNLYACLGGNRYKWDEVADIEVTAIEIDEELAKLYQDRFPNDKVIIADAHQYLLDHYREFDFIWSSPPCPTHSRLVTSNKFKSNYEVRYPEMSLYQEIILLENIYEGLYCVENVIPYYQPLIQAKKRGRHLYWTNFGLPIDIKERKSIGLTTAVGELKILSEFHDYDFMKYKGNQDKRKISRNLVDYEAGKTIFEVAVNTMRGKDFSQVGLFKVDKF
jgi:DNA (cytosine-5)-methyltransferase 1